MKQRLLFALLVLTTTSHLASATIFEYQSDSSSGATLPTAQGWTSDHSLNGTGSLITVGNQSLLYVDGRAGRAEWEILPTTTELADANAYGWQLSTTMQVLSGAYFTNYFADGSTRYLPVISLVNGELIAQLEGVTGDIVLASGSEATTFHTYDIIYLPENGGTANFYFDGELIAQDWQGSSSSQNGIIWGNGSSGTSGEAYYSQVNFEIHGDKVFTSPDRIPSAVSTDALDGTIAIFAEQRLGGGDPGSSANTNNIIARHSIDYGITWGSEQVLTTTKNVNSEYDFSDPRPYYSASQETFVVAYAQWPTAAGQNGDVIKPWMDNDIYESTYDIINQSWAEPVEIIGDPAQKSLQIIGWEGAKVFSRASTLGITDDWQFESRVSISMGGANRFSIANGASEFSVELSRDALGQLIAQTPSMTSPIIIRNALNEPYADVIVNVDFDSGAQTAEITVDGIQVIANWSGVASSAASLSFGNSDAAVDGRMHLYSLSLVRNGSLIIEYDAETLASQDPANTANTPADYGWTATTTGQGYSFYGNASINPGPGHAITLGNQPVSAGEHNGRIIYPTIVLDKYFLNVFSVYSDDGINWHHGDLLPLPYKWSGSTLKTLEPSEADLVELANGDLLMTVRIDINQTVDGVYYTQRRQFLSSNGGESWTMLNDGGAAVFSDVSSGTVDASIVRFNASSSDSYLLFTNPMGDTNHAGRYNLGLWMSFDEGDTWQGPLQLVDGGSAYSDIIQISPDTALIIFEDNSQYIRTMRLNIPALKQLLN